MALARKILIVEDDPDTAHVVGRRLTAEGYVVAVTYDVIQGTHFAHEIKPDLIILDLKVPGGGGVAFLQHMRMSANTAAIPVVVLTGVKDEAVKARIISEGVDAYLEKPYDPEKLLKTLKTVLHQDE